MLLGAPGVKPDRMIHRFVKEATGRPLTNAEADALVTAAAERLATEAHELDRAIWSYESERARSGTRR